MVTRRTISTVLAGAAMGSVLLAGCAAPPPGWGAGGPISRTKPATRLALPSAALLDHVGASAWTGAPQTWEQSRNDPDLAPRAMPDSAPLNLLEVRTRERLFTTNGRPRESSSTRTLSIRHAADR